ncbi:RNA polymerase factor sigma-54 [Verrucomicrobia bacterium]|jgi:RNA polymerase sigma-54 factor|nr:RNA polymerase factor sigma-54 [Verrucomicrobiota bacterium]
MAQGLFLSQKMALSQMLAPQLQQSLALLQAPMLELKALVNQELEQNPVLEELIEQELKSKDSSSDTESDSSKDAGESFSDSDNSNDSRDTSEEWESQIEKLSQLDQEWRDYFSETALPVKRHSKEDDERRQHMFDSLTTTTSLQETLREQVRLSDLSPDQHQIADLLIGNIDEKGYLNASIDELVFSTNTPKETIQVILELIQTFEPAGVAAIDLRECLMLQLERAEREMTLEYRILDRCFKLLGKRKFPEIARDLGVSLEHVVEATEHISRLNPRPGNAYLNDGETYVSPEVFITKTGDEYVVSTNNDHIPRIRISNTYKDLLSQTGSASDLKEYIREKIRSGKFLIKSIDQRQQTISNIAKEIVRRQNEFFDNGIAHLKPMTMMQVAEKVGVHETTVSRAVSGKYLQCAQGIFEMKFFFTSGIQTSSGTDISNATVKDIIQDMVRSEAPSKPLSDDQIVKNLLQKEIKIARRTVAKYRNELNILPSHLRKQYI